MTQLSAARPRVLIVDDEPANIHVLAEALQGAYDIRFATDGTKALELAASTDFDLVLLDVVMPGMDGLEVLRRLKAEPATVNLPVIFVTAMNEVRDEERGFALGAVDYITKPISPPIVRARVRTHVELKRQRDLLEERAFIDGLTGIANRRRFDDELDHRWRAAQRTGAALTVMLVDVDHFKQFNDNYGHGPGDDCLRRVAGALEAVFSRGEDLAARYGGEEFAVIVPGGDGSAQASRLIAGIRELRVPHAFSSAADHVTVSVGAVETVPAPQSAPKQALELADKLLYEAKQGGRNRVVHLGTTGERRTITE
ncbi:MAG TPA: diguanylate cyclase [Xanthomonadales bacterium]|nr:diguanylate cyclase [Xanthomonadales bacterium]